ncbi:nascent polypeptide-associated complex protein [Candidatus Pacearchaeota archaeon]|nr:nascent polypeptide-associated complex protein [Candidatus Pacearchaeota archaeon]
MFGNIDPKKIQSMMSKMGIKQEEIEAKRVVIELEDKNIIIENPSVIKINMQGNENFQISGDIKEEMNSEKTKQEDIKTIMERCSCSKEQAELAYKKADGDLAEAIILLSS